MEQIDHNEQTTQQPRCIVCGIDKPQDAKGWDGDTCPACAQSLRLTAALNPGMVQSVPNNITII